MHKLTFSAIAGTAAFIVGVGGFSFWLYFYDPPLKSAPAPESVVSAQTNEVSTGLSGKNQASRKPEENISFQKLSGCRNL